MVEGDDDHMAVLVKNSLTTVGKATLHPCFAVSIERKSSAGAPVFLVLGDSIVEHAVSPELGDELRVGADHYEIVQVVGVPRGIRCTCELFEPAITRAPTR